MKEQYHKQVQLLLECLPIAAKERVFALKGGTAINLLVRNDYPRASIDIDLTYVKSAAREESLQDIERGLLSIKVAIENHIPKAKVLGIANKALNIVTKLEVQFEKIAIKIEPNLILRGIVFPVQSLNTSEAVQNYYNKKVTNVPTVSIADLYAGKICAALDRQHPRDLFDIGYIIANSFSVDLKNAFLVYLISNNRPMHELLAPNLLDIKKPYESEFVGMANVDITLDKLLDNRINLIQRVKESLTVRDREFLLSIKKGEPNYSLHPINGIDKLPSIKWKLHNIKKMDKQKRAEQLKKLEKVLCS